MHRAYDSLGTGGWVSVVKGCPEEGQLPREAVGMVTHVDVKRRNSGFGLRHRYFKALNELFMFSDIFYASNRASVEILLGRRRS